MGLQESELQIHTKKEAIHHNKNSPTKLSGIHWSWDIFENLPRLFHKASYYQGLLQIRVLSHQDYNAPSCSYILTTAHSKHLRNSYTDITSTSHHVSKICSSSHKFATQELPKPEGIPFHSSLTDLPSLDFLIRPLSRFKPFTHKILKQWVPQTKFKVLWQGRFLLCFYRTDSQQWSPRAHQMKLYQTAYSHVHSFYSWSCFVVLYYIPAPYLIPSHSFSRWRVLGCLITPLMKSLITLPLLYYLYD